MDIQKLTVGQFQEIWKLAKTEMDEEEKMTEMVAVLSGKTPNEVDLMPVPDFNRLAADIRNMLSKPMPEVEPKRVLAGWGITYEPAKLNRGQYVTLMHFIGGDVIENCTSILASLAYDLKTGKHPADRHKEIAEKLEQAPIVDVYATTVFFCKLFVTSMRVFQDYLEKELIKTGMESNQARTQVASLMNDMDGFILPTGLLSGKVSAYGTAGTVMS